jgi:hypothetical protein
LYKKKRKCQQVVGNSSSKAFGISFADRPKANKAAKELMNKKQLKARKK